MATPPRAERDFSALRSIVTAVQPQHDFSKVAIVRREALAKMLANQKVILTRNLSDQLDQVVATHHGGGILYAESVREFKKRFILTVLADCNWNRCLAARELGMHRNTLSRAIAELKIDVFAARRAKKPRAANLPNESAGFTGRR